MQAAKRLFAHFGRVVPTARPATVTSAKSGPVELQARQLSQVSGGQAASGLGSGTTTTCSPKGGWA